MNNQNKKLLPVWALILIDVLAICLALLIFAFFHHVLPRIINNNTAASETESYTQTSSVSATPQQETGIGNLEDSRLTETPPEAEEVKDTWKFAGKTTDEIVYTDHSYTSPDIAIEITSYEAGEIIDSPYTVADIYVRDVRCLQAYFAGAKYIETGHGDTMLNLMSESSAIVATNGDYYSMQLQSGVLRNGVLYRYPANNYDVFVLYDDGSVQIIKRNTYHNKADWDTVFENAWQAWSFGPSLLDESGVPYDDFRNYIFDVMANRNPRTGIGYYEPGHYCLVVVDGRSKEAPGASMEELAALFQSLGCTKAYNLDGGGSSVMAFNGEIITNQSAERKLPDIILVTEYEGSFAQKEAQMAEESDVS